MGPLSARRGVVASLGAVAAGCAGGWPARRDADAPALTPEQSRRLALHTTLHERAVVDGGGRTRMAPAPRPMPLSRAAAEPPIRWRANGAVLDLDAFVRRQPVVALWVAQGRTVHVARHRHGFSPTDLHVSNSMAKSVTSIAVGFALAEGRIASVDDPAQRYVPGLRGHAYGATTIRNLLRMGSGVRFSERYDGRDDAARFARELARVGIVEAAAGFDEREAPQGSRFAYASAETYVLGAVVRGATGEGLSRWLEPRLWQPMGAAHDAWWRTDRHGLERAAGSLSATPDDWIRLGLLLAHDGVRPDTGARVLPPGFLDRAADLRAVDPPFRPGPAGAFGYGQQFWLLPGPRRQFALLGVYGQAIFVDPAARLAMLQLAANETALASDTSLARERWALWRGVVDAFAGAA